MRTLGIVAFVTVLGTACGGPATRGPTPPPAGAPTVFPAARFVPMSPSYVLSARTVKDGQGALLATLEMAGLVDSVDATAARGRLAALLGIDIFDEPALVSAGIDTAGSAVVFSESIEPTIVLHLRAPDQTKGFFDGRAHGAGPLRSTIEQGVEIFTAKVEAGLHVSWAIDGDWLWLHLDAGTVDGIEWFTHSRKPTGASWVDGFTWARAQAQGAAVDGVIDVARLLAGQKAVACAQQLAAVRRVAVAFDADRGHASARVAFDLGPSAEAVRGIVLAPPPGWTVASASAPVSAQVNVDLPTVARWLSPCLRGEDLFDGTLASVGVRAGRGFLRDIDPDESEGVGAIAADLSSAAYLRKQLDQVPGRGAFESSRTFGVYKGKHLKVPMFVTADYVLTDTLAIAAMGDGVLAQVGTAPAAPAAFPLAELRLRPPGLSADKWEFLVRTLGGGDPRAIVAALSHWSEVGVVITLDGTSLTLSALAARR